MKGGDLYDRVTEATRDLMRGLCMEVVDVTVSGGQGRPVVRIAVDKEGGVTLDDCAAASELIGQVLDRENLFPGAFVLEVMSPGLDRPLKRKEDYARSTGKRVRVSLRTPYEGRQSFTGILRDAGEETVRLDLGDEELELRYDSMTSARLDPELPW